MAANQDLFFRFTSVAMEKKTYLNMLYLLLMFPLGIIYFVILITGISLSMSLTVILVGLFIGVGFLMLVRGISSVHLNLASTLLGFDYQKHTQNDKIQGDLIEKMKQIIKDERTYTSIIYMFIEFPLGILYFTLIITLMSISLSFMLTPVFHIFWESGAYYFDTDNWMWDLDLEESLLLLVGGIFLFFVTLHMSNMFAKVEEILCKSLLVRTP